jgi:hypothetical protein
MWHKNFFAFVNSVLNAFGSKKFCKMKIQIIPLKISIKNYTQIRIKNPLFQKIKMSLKEEGGPGGPERA